MTLQKYEFNVANFGNISAERENLDWQITSIRGKKLPIPLKGRMYFESNKKHTFEPIGITKEGQYHLTRTIGPRTFNPQSSIEEAIVVAIKEIINITQEIEGGNEVIEGYPGHNALTLSTYRHSLDNIFNS